MVWSEIEGVIWDWGDTLMRDIPGQPGPMVFWPRVEAMPGAPAALSALSRLFVQCVGTNATESDGEMVGRALARVGLRGYLQRFFTSAELGVSKPDPGFFEAIAVELAMEPEKLVSIGNDLQKDIVPAKAVGMATILVSSAPGGITSDAVDLIVPSLSDLVDLLQDNPGNPTSS